MNQTAQDMGVGELAGGLLGGELGHDEWKVRVVNRVLAVRGGYQLW